MKSGDLVLADTIDGRVLCTILAITANEELELEPVNGEVAWGKCWLKPNLCKLIKSAPLLRSIK